MRHIHLTDELRLRFPGRTEEFDLGVEIGAIAILMDMEITDFAQWLSSANLEQARELAAKMGYRLTEAWTDGNWTKTVFRRGQARPQLTLIHSA